MICLKFPPEIIAFFNLCSCVLVHRKSLRLLRLIKLSNFPFRRHSFCVPNSASTLLLFLWVDRIYWPMPTLRVVYTTRKNHWPASMKLFSRRRFSAVCSSLTHFQRLFASSACAIDWAGIFRHFYRRLIFRNRSKQARNCKKTGTHNSRYMLVNVLACEWLEREFEREIRQKNGVIDHDTNLIAKNLVVDWRRTTTRKLCGIELYFKRIVKRKK